jgi:hypothetical protein
MRNDKLKYESLQAIDKKTFLQEIEKSNPKKNIKLV